MFLILVSFMLHIVMITSRSLHELQPEVTCKDNEHFCYLPLGLGYCVTSERICNGWWDCPQGTDEVNCTCSSSEFACRSGGCVSSDLVCDGGENCQDASDELECKCPEGMFRCWKIHSCIYATLRCNGFPDCYDKTDEEGCTCDLNTQFVCESGGCVDINKKCDGRFACLDGSDEKSCVCEQNEFACTSGGCVPQSRRCDGRYHCQDKSDEQGCVCHEEFEFGCLSGGCIDIRYKCDQRVDCEDESDEDECNEPFYASQVVAVPSECPPQFPTQLQYHPLNNSKPITLRMCTPDCRVTEGINSAFKGIDGKFTYPGNVLFEYQFDSSVHDIASGYLVRKFCMSVKGVRTVVIFFVTEGPFGTFKRQVDIVLPEIWTKVCSSMFQFAIRGIVVGYAIDDVEKRDINVRNTNLNLCLRPAGPGVEDETSHHSEDEDEMSQNIAIQLNGNS